MYSGCQSIATNHGLDCEHKGKDDAESKVRNCWRLAEWLPGDEDQDRSNKQNRAKATKQVFDGFNEPAGWWR